jgi:hypothetical protein
MSLLQFQIEHYTKLLADTPTFVVTEKGDIELNPAKRFRRMRLFYLKKELNQC